MKVGIGEIKAIKRNFIEIFNKSNCFNPRFVSQEKSFQTLKRTRLSSKSFQVKWKTNMSFIKPRNRREIIKFKMWLFLHIFSRFFFLPYLSLHILVKFLSKNNNRFVNKLKILVLKNDEIIKIKY